MSQRREVSRSISTVIATSVHLHFYVSGLVKRIEPSCRLQIMFVGDGRFSTLAGEVQGFQNVLRELDLW